MPRNSTTCCASYAMRVKMRRYVSSSDVWQLRRYQDKAYVMSVLGQFDQNLVLPWHGEAELGWPALDRVLLSSQYSRVGYQL